MKLEQQVCTLEQAKRLKELGVDQNCSYLCFLENSAGKYMLDTIEGNFNSHCRDYEISVHPGGFEASFVEQAIAVFTVAELGVMIDWNHVSQSGPYKEDQHFYCFTHLHDYSNENEAVVRADVLIYLLENNLTTAEEVNQRLNN